ncbi:MAG: DNA repair protein RecN [Pseudomonadota bacterium]
MLTSLEIRDMLIIDQMALEFRPGLNVLTGETGAGKSILLDALGFVLGWRGRAELVRGGAERGEVVAVFDLAPDHPALEVLEEAGFAADGELILRRVNTSDGRKSAWVNDQRASGDVLRRLSRTLVELHGQQDDRGLLDARGHRALLDSFAGAEDARQTVRAAWQDWRQAEADHRAVADRLQAVRAEEEFLRHAQGELTTLAPETGEDDRLDTERRRMQAGARVEEELQRAGAALGPDGAEAMLVDATRWLEACNDQLDGAADAALASIQRAMEGLGEAQAATERLQQELAHDPAALEGITERLFALRDLARKHKVASDDLPALAATVSERIAALDAGDRDLTAAADKVAKTAAAYDTAAEALTALRRDAAARLDQAMGAELAPLKLDRALFTTEITAGEAGPDGRDQVQFTVATNPGAPAGPLNKIASGGELSRFLLALKVCLTGGASGLTLIFDEIDRGIGGATADAVGRRLGNLAAAGQVLVVTHSPQVAALGSHHWRVEKRIEGPVTLSRVVALDPGSRIDEIARMLAGDTVTEEARGAARALLAG